MEQSTTNLVLLKHHRHRFLLVEHRLPGTTAFRVGCERQFEFMGKAQVIDNQASAFVHKYPVDPRDCLHQAVAAHRFIDIHGMQVGSVKTG